jgi:glycerol uptake facilitator-like aquaporin
MRQRLVSELIGTALLLAAVVGSGIMGERLAGGSLGLALLANTIATGAALVALIVAFAGSHFNPVVTVADAWLGGTRWPDVPGLIAAQFAGAVCGVLLAHTMFGEPLISFSRHARAGAPQILSEFVATFGLLAIIWGSARTAAAPFAIAGYIVAAYWFTASTSFANPAVTLARCLTDTFAGIRPADVPGFILGQCTGAAAATALFRWLHAARPQGDRQ